jgi:carboxypeptidase C (cathepsin A)
MYPEFLSNPFYIAGESYAGVYVPTLSHEVVKGMAFAFYSPSAISYYSLCPVK